MSAGGARPGAGRKPAPEGAKTLPRNVSLTRAEWDGLAEMAKARGLASANALLAILARKLLTQTKENVMVNVTYETRTLKLQNEYKEPKEILWFTPNGDVDINFSFFIADGLVFPYGTPVKKAYQTIYHGDGNKKALAINFKDARKEEPLSYSIVEDDGIYRNIPDKARISVNSDTLRITKEFEYHVRFANGGGFDVCEKNGGDLYSKTVDGQRYIARNFKALILDGPDFVTFLWNIGEDTKNVPPSSMIYEGEVTKLEFCNQ